MRPALTSPPHAPPQNVYVNINRIMSVASRLVESGHYASQQIKQIASQLEQEWKAFAAALDERSTLLDMSSVFHQKAEKVSAWEPGPCLPPPAPRSRASETTGVLKSPRGAQPCCRPGVLLHLLVCKVEVKVMELRGRLTE